MGPTDRLSAIQNRISDIIQIPERFNPRPAAATTARASTRTVPETGTENQSPSPRNAAVDAMLRDPRRGGLSFKGELEALIQDGARKHGVHPDLIRAVIKTESGGRADAVSPVGAIGLMQLMPETARQLGVDPRDPAENIDGGVRYLKSMAYKFGSLDQALAAYNAGPGAVQKFGGVPPYRETMNYVKKIKGLLDLQG